MHHCDNCNWEGPTSDLKWVYPSIPRLLARMDPGGKCPSGECPGCEALCYEGGTMRKEKRKARYVMDLCFEVELDEAELDKALFGPSKGAIRNALEQRVRDIFKEASWAEAFGIVDKYCADESPEL